MSEGRPSKLIRNTGNHRTVTYGGRDYQFPGGGDTTMVSGELADFVEQNHARDGLLVVHPEAEAAARASQAELEAEAGTAPLESLPPVAPPVEPEAEVPLSIPLVEPVPDPPAPAKPAKPSKKTAAKKR
jgi:hypothetical protein